MEYDYKEAMKLDHQLCFPLPPPRLKSDKLTKPQQLLPSIERNIFSIKKLLRKPCYSLVGVF